MKLPRITAKFRVVTPLMLHGVNKNRVELRIPSIKGALRYWYRAANPDYKDTVDSLGITQEEYLFGGANGKAGQSAFLMRLSKKPKGNPKFFTNKSFEIEFLLRPNLKQEATPDWRGLLVSIWLLGHFGGVGAKVRRGYGMIALEEWRAEYCEKLQSMIEEDFPILHNAKSPEDWEEKLEKCWKNIVANRDSHDEQEHSILDHYSSLYVSKVKVQNTGDARKEGADLIQAFCSENKIDAAIFGVPRPYEDQEPPKSQRSNWKSSKKKKNAQIWLNPTDCKRIPSPVWLKVFKINGQYHSAFLFLTTKCPKELRLGKKQQKVNYAGAIQSFKDQLKQKQYRRVCGYE